MVVGVLATASLVSRKSPGFLLFQRRRLLYGPSNGPAMAKELGGLQLDTSRSSLAASWFARVALVDVKKGLTWESQFSMVKPVSAVTPSSPS